MDLHLHIKSLPILYKFVSVISNTEVVYLISLSVTCHSVVAFSVYFVSSSDETDFQSKKKLKVTFNNFNPITLFYNVELPVISHLNPITLFYNVELPVVSHPFKGIIYAHY